MLNQQLRRAGGSIILTYNKSPTCHGSAGIQAKNRFSQQMQERQYLITNQYEKLKGGGKFVSLVVRPVRELLKESVIGQQEPIFLRTPLLKTVVQKCIIQKHKLDLFNCIQVFGRDFMLLKRLAVLYIQATVLVKRMSKSLGDWAHLHHNSSF